MCTSGPSPRSIPRRPPTSFPHPPANSETPHSKEFPLDLLIGKRRRLLCRLDLHDSFKGNWILCHQCAGLFLMVPNRQRPVPPESAGPISYRSRLNSAMSASSGRISADTRGILPAPPLPTSNLADVVRDAAAPGKSSPTTLFSGESASVRNPSGSYRWHEIMNDVKLNPPKPGIVRPRRVRQLPTKRHKPPSP